MRFLPITALLALSTLAAHAEIQFVGVMTLNGQQQFGLQDTESQKSKWLSIGSQFSEFTLESYQATESTVTIRKGDSVKQLKLQNGSFVPPKSLEPAPEYYSVKAGDTLPKIAHTHKMSVKDLLTLNREVDPILKIGDSIRIK